MQLEVIGFVKSGQVNQFFDRFQRMPIPGQINHKATVVHVGRIHNGYLGDAKPAFMHFNQLKQGSFGHQESFPGSRP